MGCPSEVYIGDNLTFSICTHDPDTGVLTDATSTLYYVYEDETGADILTGALAKLDDAATTGFYTETIACTAGNGFETGKTYTIYIEATVDGDTGGICFSFKTNAMTAEIATKLATSASTMVIGTVSWDNTNATTTIFYSRDITEATADHYNRRLVFFTSGDLIGQCSDILDYELVTGEGKFTVTTLTEAPADNVTFIIV